jgi:hypothetical protein
MDMSKTIGNNTVRLEWREIDWKKVERHVFRLQKRTYQAKRRGDVATNIATMQKLPMMVVLVLMTRAKLLSPRMMRKYQVRL